MSWVDSFSDSFLMVSNSIWSLSFGQFYSHAYISIIHKEYKLKTNNTQQLYINFLQNGKHRWCFSLWCWLWCSNYIWLLDMLDNNDITNGNVSEAVEKIPCDKTRWSQMFFLFYALHSYNSRFWVSSTGKVRQELTWFLVATSYMAGSCRYISIGTLC